MELKESKCDICYGYGWWAFGDLCPVGRMDSTDMGDNIVKCPWCKVGKINKGERYKMLCNKKKEIEI